jgi:flagellar assembly protein FliH
LSNRIIPKEMVGGDLRKAKLDELSLGERARRPEQAKPPAPSAGNELARVREEAYRQGVAAGRQEAALQAQAERAALKNVSDALNEMMQEFEQGLANDVLSMSLELTKLIVRHAIRVKPDLVLSVVREAVASLTGLDGSSTVHLNPADAALLRELAREDPALGALPWKIIEDTRIERGGCRLETATSEVDATLETRWRRVIAALGREDSWIDITL